MPSPPLPETNTAPIGDLTGYELIYGDVPDDQEAAVEQAILDASSIVRALASLTITLVEDETVTMDGSGTNLLLLPEWPVTDVHAVMIRELDGSETDVPEDEYDWSETKGILQRRHYRPWPYRFQSVTLTYTHGWTTPPADIVRVVYNMVARALAAGDGRDVKSKTLGQASVTYVDVGRVGLTSWEEAVIQRIRLR